MTVPEQFDAAEQAAIAAEFDRLSAEAMPASKGPAAVALLAAGLAVLLMVPRALHPSGVAAAAVLVVAILLMAAGALLWVFGRSAYGTWTGRAEDAITWLVCDYPGEPEQRRRAAVAAIYYAFLSEGPTTVHTYDFAAAAQQLGPALEDRKSTRLNSSH